MTAAPIERTSGRVLVVDRDDRVLLLRGSDPAEPAAGDWWFTPGGGLDPGESVEEGALRELREETGLVLGHAGLGTPVWRRTARFSFMGRAYRQDETFFLVRVEQHEVDFGGLSDLEKQAVHEFRWWTLDELETSGITVYPTALAAELALLLAQPEPDWRPAEPKDVGA